MAIIKRKIENLKPGKEYIVTARAKNADVNVVSNYTDTIRFQVPVDTTIPEEVFNLKLYQGVESVMFVFDNVSDKDILTYEYELYSDISGTQLVSTGYNDASVFTVAVDNLQTDAQGQGLVPYWGRVRAIDTSNNTGAWTPLAKTDERVPLIDNQFIGSLTASKITAGSIGAHEIILTQPGPQTTINVPALSSVLRSSNYNGNYNSTTGVWTEGRAGWIITGDGRAEFNNAIIRGNFRSITLDVGDGDKSFHIDIDGNIWSGSASLATAKFSVLNDGKVRILNGSIDIGEGANSFHVGEDGRLWFGATRFEDAKLQVEPWGDMKITGSFEVGDSYYDLASFNGSARVEGDFYTSGTFLGNSMDGDLRVGFLPGTTLQYPLMWFHTGNYGASPNNFGHTKIMLRRTKDLEYRVDGVNRSSNWHLQMIQVMNESAAPNQPGSDTVAGIAFGVGRLDQSAGIYGCTLRCFPGSGGSSITPLESREFITGLVDDTNLPGLNVESRLPGENDFIPNDGNYYTGPYGGLTGAGWNGLDVGNFMGDGYGYMGALSFVVRSSKKLKQNVEYMPVESRSISVERIRNLKPARWDDKAKLSYGAPSEKFQEINKRWIAKGRTPLQFDQKYIQTYEHDCIRDNCIGSEFKNCPQVEFQKKRYGFIAEDVAEVFPKAVQFSTLGQPMGIDYSVITYSLVETTQHLLDKIDQLEAKISQLTAENNN